MSQLNGVFSLRTARDLREKLEVDFSRLSHSDPSSIEAQYAAFDFFVCAEHIPDWLAKTAGGSKSCHRSYRDGALVSHIANGAKHFQVKDTRHITVKDTTAIAGAFDAGAFDRSVFQIAKLVIELESGASEDVLEVAARVIAHWRNVLP